MTRTASVRAASAARANSAVSCGTTTPDGIGIRIGGGCTLVRTAVAISDAAASFVDTASRAATSCSADVAKERVAATACCAASPSHPSAILLQIIWVPKMKPMLMSVAIARQLSARLLIAPGSILWTSR
ncbi:hypothetical protein [Rhodococcus ruber]|uniref:hypothetical protein n=1 Tax=Rhodococcus ruber TaxID=1830 RepID=UPI001F25E28F|nr:hypothetical protein [Rhodococcus ruber]